jgi:hypothetical protein
MHTLLLLAALAAPTDYWVSGHNLSYDVPVTVHFRLDPDAEIVGMSDTAPVYGGVYYAGYFDGELIGEESVIATHWIRQRETNSTIDRDTFMLITAIRGYIYMTNNSLGVVDKTVLPDFTDGQWDLQNSRVFAGPGLADGLTMHIGPDPPIGDSDYNLRFDFDDILAVMGPGKYETGLAATWSEGDWNKDGLFDFGDVLGALSVGSYESGGFAARQVAEPYLVVMLMPLIFLIAARCH